MGGHGRVVGHRPEKATHHCPPTGEEVGLWRAEAFMVQRPANLPLEPAEAIVRHPLRDGMAHTVVARTGYRTVVVRPRQDLEREMFVGLEVLDQRRTPAHIRLLQFGRGAVAHDGAVVAQRLVDGVVAAGADQHGIAGVPHSAAAGVGECAAELVGRLDDRHRKSFAGSGVRASESARATGHQDVDGFLSFGSSGHRFLDLLTKRPSLGEKSHPPPALVPPSTGMLWPVTNAD